MKIYKDEDCSKISFPLGGIGTGSLGLSGAGRFIDWEIFNRPNKLSYNGMSHFAVKAERNGQNIDTRVLHGPFTGDLSGVPKSFGFGPPRESMAGVPHFQNCEFRGEFPFAELVFSDPEFPGKVILTAFNPFIPLNSKDSSIPAAMFDVRFENTTDEDIDYSLYLTVTNPWTELSINEFSIRDGISLMHLRSCLKSDLLRGDICIATDSKVTSYQENWFRGSWFDGLGVYWRELNNAAKLKVRSYGMVSDATLPGGITDVTFNAVLASHLKCRAGQAVNTRMSISWNVPFCHNYWDDRLNQEELDALKLENRWRNYYATQWRDSIESAVYVFKNWQRLYDDTKKFADALYNTTIPEVFIEAVGANLSVLKSPTCLRLEDGSFYAFEGCTADSGCCEGSCSHVWNYAYALPFLFPDLERSMRELEYKYNLRKSGEIPMRLMLPLGRHSRYRACADGQFGTIIKVYREWKVSGDDQWLRKIWDGVKKSLEYAWHPDNEDRWDPEQSGILTGRQHHTLDMELFGPNAWLSGFYLAALKAAAEMAEFMADKAAASRYMSMYISGRKKLNSELFNGEYFQQQIDLNDRNILEPYSASTGCANKDHNETVFEAYWNSEHGEIKYQIGDGCAIDQVLGQWHANLTGLGDIFDQDKIVSALCAIYRYNFKPDMREHFNPCRVFSVENESGTVMCEWPEGRYKPWVPLTYAEENMHGFEYALAGQMIQYGLLDEAAQIVKAVRDHYDGRKRNPWNEIECGSNYARSMASFAFIPSFSGFKCDMSKGELTFDPVALGENYFRSFWSIGSAWGVVEFAGDKISLQVLYGTLRIRSLILPMRQPVSIAISGKNIACRCEEERLYTDDWLEIKSDESIEVSTKQKVFRQETIEVY